ncbi:MAG TPA: hypothetical protein ENL03_02735 [Phycisphaerae bacterium]|nr:hypothetical protein [Phycisphaerae bacterium]
MMGIPQWNFQKGDIVGKKQAKIVNDPVMDMVVIPGGEFVRADKNRVKVGGFEMSKFPATYDRWKTVKQWGEANGYDFDHNGDMGSMFFFDFTHSPDEPVTNITWFDIITWCNALSEMEGKTPCFYYDEACTKVVRSAYRNKALKVDGPEYIMPGVHPDLKGFLVGHNANPWIFTRWDVDGYRLPTAAEMDYAIRGGKATSYHWGSDAEAAGDYMWNASNSKGRTHKVGLKKENPYGLHDIQGNVFEFSFSASIGRKSRPGDLDLDNPIGSPFHGWQLPKQENGAINHTLLIGGPSFLFGGYNINGSHGVGVESSPATGLTHYYSDVGFRPVRCKAGTHPRNGLRPLSKPKTVQYMKIDPAKYKEPDAIYRGDLRRSGVFNKTGVTSQPTAKWKTKIGGEIFSSPVVASGKLFIGSADGIHCLNADSGEEIWKFPVAGGVDSSACVADEAVLFATKRGQLLSINIADGKRNWVYKGKAKSVKSSPAVVYGVVFCGLGLETVAVDLKKGKKIWSFKDSVPGEFSSLVMGPKAIYVTGTLAWGYLNSFNYNTSEKNWKSNGPYVGGAGVYFYKSPSMDTTSGLYVNTTRGVRKYDANIVGKNAKKGVHMRIWQRLLLDKGVEDNTFIPHASPSVWNDVVFAGRTHNKGGKMAAINAKDGKLIWQQLFDGPCISDPSIAAKSSLVIFGCHNGNVYALDCKNGDEKWKFKTGGVVFASPWIGDGIVYVASQDGFVYALK